jgi:outer membrane protein
MIWGISKKKLLTVLLAVIVCNLGFAQETLKIGVVDSQKIFDESIQGKKIQTEIVAFKQKKQNEISKLEQKIQDLQKKLTSQKLTLSQESFMNIQSDLERKQLERNWRAEDARREIDDLIRRRSARLQKELQPIIDKISKEKGLDIVFDLSVARNPVVYHNPAIELTKEVIDRYDNQKIAK